MLEILIFFVAHWYLSLFSQTFLHHRYAAHAAFKMNKFWERAFFIFAYITQGSSYLSPRAYAVMHRVHHAYTDTEKDPHSPAYDRSMIAMMKRTAEVYSGIYSGKIKVDERFQKNVPDWPALDRWGHSWASRIMWGVLYFAFYFYFATSPWLYLLLPINMLMGPVHGAIINWFAHKYGYVNFKVGNTSKNLLPFDFLMLGEGYHNNHHKYPSSVNFGLRWHEFDPVYPIIRLFNWLGIIQVREAAMKRVDTEF
jgi:stearoyl-CoA desaturase (Delta-9 desaturase)